MLAELAAMFHVFDVAQDVTRKIPQLKAQGIDTVICYISPGNSGKNLTRARAKALGDAGINVALVFEVWGGSGRRPFEHNDINANTGARDGAWCRNFMLNVLRCPADTAVYWTCDTDATPAQQRDLVIPYGKAFAEGLGAHYRAGAYAPGAILSKLLDLGYIKLAWLPNATGWPGYREFKASNRWSLLQGREQGFLGLSIDPDATNPALPDIGSYLPEAAPLPMATSKIGAAQVVGGTVAGVTGVASAVTAVVQPITDAGSAVSNTIDSVTPLVQSAPVGFWREMLHVLTSPTFIAFACLALVVCAALTWFWRRQHRQEGV